MGKRCFVAHDETRRLSLAATGIRHVAAGCGRQRLGLSGTNAANDGDDGDGGNVAQYGFGISFTDNGAGYIA